LIQLYECPNCGRDSAAFVYDEIADKTYCPACSPTPNKTAHDYRPRLTMLGGVNLISGVCCADAGDCGHVCGVA